VPKEKPKLSEERSCAKAGLAPTASVNATAPAVSNVFIVLPSSSMPIEAHASPASLNWL
jgi:hypothetical protein